MSEKVIYIQDIKKRESVDRLRETLRKTIELALKTEEVDSIGLREDIEAVNKALQDGDVDALRGFLAKDDFPYIEVIRIYIAALDEGQ